VKSIDSRVMRHDDGAVHIIFAAPFPVLLKASRYLGGKSWSTLSGFAMACAMDSLYGDSRPKLLTGM
jgi:hypothetical protein